MSEPAAAGMRRNHLTRVRKIMRECGCSRYLAQNIDNARQSIRSLPKWMRGQMHFRGTNEPTNYSEETP